MYTRAVAPIGLVALLVITGCRDHDPTSLVLSRSVLLSTASTYFLPPLAPARAAAAPLDATLLPHVTVEVRECASACTTLVAQFTSARKGAEAIRVGRDGKDDHYIVNWHTGQSALRDGRSYEVAVLVANTPLVKTRLNATTKGGAGVAEIKIGQTVPIKFRIEQGAAVVMTSAGGIVSSGAVMLAFPQNAVSSPVAITVTARSSTPPVNGGFVVAGTVFELGRDGLVFNQPVRLTIAYDPANLNGRPETSLRLQKITNGGWADVPGFTVDRAAKTASGILSGFSGYGIVSYENYLPVLSGTGTATLDGIISAGEWDKAGQVNFWVFPTSTDTLPATLYVMNDHQNLYIAVKFGQTSSSTRRRLAIVFDNDGDGVQEAGDDALLQVFVDPEQAFNDMHISKACNGFWCGDDQNNGADDGAGFFKDHGSNAIFEISKPLNSTDSPNDFSVLPGDVLGFLIAVIYNDGEGPELVMTTFPGPPLFDDPLPNTPGTFAKIVIQHAPVPTLSGFGTATVDGTMDFFEWQQAACVTFDANVPEGGTTPAKFCVMNDLNNLYYAVEYARTAVDVTGHAVMQFDVSGSGAIDGGDDMVILNRDGSFEDHHWNMCGSLPCHGPDFNAGGGTQGGGVVVHNGSTVVFEAWKPLTTADGPLDVSLIAGNSSTDNVRAAFQLLIQNTLGVGAYTGIPAGSDLFRLKLH